ncbi:BT4734/BF3469 family protein [Larkinella sp. GY13]|uniref:BT4734/BF3469 family protein n=1 Tax=Larkinella sp. GY13 TaxID=3453720 RepID=UPI003EEAF5DE
MIERLQTYSFSFFKGGIRVNAPSATLTLADAVRLISDGTYRQKVQQIRTFPDPKARKPLKEGLDYVTFSGVFAPTRLVKNLKQHSRLLVLDFDHVENLDETRLQLQADPHTLVLFASPSGDGLKLILEIDPDRHPEAFADLAFYFRQTYRLDVDASGSDVSRPCFLSYDPDVYLNPNAEPYKIKGLATRKEKPKTDIQIKKDATEVFRHVAAVVERIEAAQVDITGNYSNEWLLIAFCMATLGEDGRALFHQVSQFNPNYTVEDADEKFTNAVQTTRFTHPWKFFQIAKDYNIDVSKTRKEKKVAESSDQPDPEAKSVDKPKKADRILSQNVDYRDGGIWIWGTKNWICVAENFQIYVKYCTEDENEEKTWILEILRIGITKPLYIEISHEEFCSATKLKNKLASHRLALKITDTYLGELWQHMFRMNFPNAVKVTRLGYHPESRVFFFSNKAISVDSADAVLEPDEFGIVAVNPPDGQPPLCLSMPVVKKKRAHLFQLSPGTLTFNDWFGLLVQVHKYENAIIPAAFYLMALFRDLVVKHTNASPILYLKGGASSGKSSIARSLCRLYNLHEAVANLKNKNTEAGLVRVMSHTSNGVIWMDEYHNDFPFEGLLQSAYDDNGYIRAEENSRDGTDTIDIYSALVLTSNYIPENPIFFSRCLFVPITEQQKTDEQVEAFARFKDIEQDGLSFVTLEMLKHRALVEANLKQAYDDLYTPLKEATRHEKPVERLISNMARVLSVAYILQIFGKINLQFEVTSDDDILDEFVAIGTRGILRQHTIQTEKTALSEFFEIIQNQYENGFIQEDIHFRFEGSLLHLRFPSLYTIYAQKYRQTFWKSPAERDTLRDEILAFEAPDDPNNFFRNIRFNADASDPSDKPKRVVTGSCSMTYSKLTDKFGVDFRGKRVERTMM